MPDIAVINASPLIFLARVDGLVWLPRFCPGEILIPQSVETEVRAGDDGDAVMAAALRLGSFRVVADADMPPVVAAWDLGAGESAVLAQCVQRPGALAVLDDAAARMCARSLSLPVVGTLGVVLAAKQAGHLVAARPIVERLRKSGLYLSEALASNALREVGE